MEYIIERGARLLPESAWQPVFQRSIDAFYQGRFAAGRDACLALLAEPGLPTDIRELTYRNQGFYAQALSEMIADARWTVLDTPELAGWNNLAPGPVWTGERSLVLLRGLVGEGPAIPNEVVLIVDDALRVLGITNLRDETGEAHRFEQIRPFFTERLHAGVVIRSAADDGHRLSGVVDIDASSWRWLCHFGPRAGDFQRGWSPVVTPGGPCVVAWWEPTEVFRFEAQYGAVERVALRMASHVAERFEGGSAGVAVPGGFLFLVNERVASDDDVPLIFSRFVRLDESFQIDAISPQFFVADRGRDEASGLTRQGNRLVAGFSSDNQRALLAICDVEGVLATLIPIGAPGKPRGTGSR